jgi:predicted transposase YdaD
MLSPDEEFRAAFAVALELESLFLQKVEPLILYVVLTISLNSYRIIDLVMILPKAVEREFWQELQVFEEERKVTYVTNVERFGIEKGVIQEERSLILRLLSRRVGVLSSEVRSQVESLSLEQLESLGEALLDFSSAADLDEWLRTLGA